MRPPRKATPGTKITPRENTWIAKRHAQGATIHAIARELGRSTSGIRIAAKRLGLTFASNQTAAATHAAALSARQKRAEFEHLLLDEAKSILEDLHKPHTEFSFGGKDNIYNEHTFPGPTIDGKLKIMQAVGSGLDRALKISTHDGATDIDQARSLITSLADHFGITGA